MRRTGFVYDERCELHDNGSMLRESRVQDWLDIPHAENAERLRRSNQVLERSGVLDALVRVPAREATAEELELVHPASHVEKIRAASERGGLEWVGPEARVSAGTWTAAVLAVGALLEAVDRVVAGDVDNAFVCCRPPGHHASAEEAMGFCLFNSVAVAARYLQSRHRLERVAIVDWDVHHGNGTEAIFWDDPSVLFVSMHQWPFYPGTGGPGDGNETTLNVPLPAGSGDADYERAFVEKSVIVFGSMEATLTPLMEEIERNHPRVKVFSLPSVDHPEWGRHIDLGVKGDPSAVEAAYPRLIEGLKSLGAKLGPELVR